MITSVYSPYVCIDFWEQLILLLCLEHINYNEDSLGATLPYVITKLQMIFSRSQNSPVSHFCLSLKEGAH